MPLVTIIDECVGIPKEIVLTLDCLTEELTTRELIRQRVYQEVADYNQKFTADPNQPLPKLLVTPTEMEARLNSKPSKIAPNLNPRTKQIDWQEQCELACRGFESNAFFILIDDRQAEDLDEAFRVTIDTEITFVKLVPLVGG